MNISLAKVGVAAYASTAWFGKRSHSGEVYAEEVKRLVGKGDKQIAACADNTSSNTSMQKGLFGKLAELFSWFYIGCCVHAMDLLSEDIAKIPEIASAISDCKFIVVFVIRYSMLHETFMDSQAARRKHDPTASMLGLKKFPDTRFAYAFFMIFSVFVNWSVLTALPNTPEFKLMKRAARDTEKSKRRAHFLKFENLVGSAVNMRGCEAAVALMRPISQALHYLEGDNVESSHVAAVFVVADQNAKSPAPEITDYFDSATMDLVKGCFEDRWNGAGRKVGVKHGVHCLSFKVDMVLRCTIKHALGAPFLAAIDGSFRRSSWDTALLTYCKQDNSRYTKLVMEMTKFNSKTGDYASLWRQADAIAKETVAEIVQKLDSDTKANPLRLLIAILKHTDEKGHKSISSRPLWGSIAQEEAASLSERLFGMMCVEVLSIVT